MIRDLSRGNTKEVRQAMNLKQNYEGVKRALVQERGVGTRQHADQGYGWRGHLVSRVPIANLKTVPKDEFDTRTSAGRNRAEHDRIPKAHFHLYVALDEGPQRYAWNLEVNREHGRV